MYIDIVNKYILFWTYILVWQRWKYHCCNYSINSDLVSFMVLKLNPKKCYFTCNQVTYLGHTITPSGLKPNSSYLMAEKIFLVPKDIKSLKQFLRLSSFYWWCVCNFTKLVEPCIGWQGRIHHLYEAQLANNHMTLSRVHLSNLQCWLNIMLSRIFAWRQMLLWKA